MIRMAVLVAAAAAAAVLLNVLLLGRASGSSDPVGNLKPLVDVQPAATVPSGVLRRPPAKTVDDHADD